MRRKAPMLCLSLKVNVDLTGNVTEFLSHDLFFFFAHVYTAPTVFPMAYNLIKHLLNESTRKKIHVLGSKYYMS